MRNTLVAIDTGLAVGPGIRAKIVHPMRVTVNGTGSEIQFTLGHQQGVLDRQFPKSARLVANHRRCLK